VSLPRHAPSAVEKVERPGIEGFTARIEAWLAAHIPSCADSRIKSISQSASSGLSGDTYIISVERPGAAATPGTLVLRKDVQDKKTNPLSNFANLVLVQTALGDAGTLPVPRVLGAEACPDTLGAPFVVMEFVEGDIPSDVPSYAAAGWVQEATAGQRRKMWRSGIDFLVRLHAVDWREHDLGGLRVAAPGAHDLERSLNQAVSMFRHEADGQSSPICERAICWLTANLPATSRECICWGDARIGNMIWRDFECVAVIDWEMSCLGTPGIDLGWWSFFHRWSTLGQGIADLEGMVVGQSLLNLYHDRGGTRIDGFLYYEVLAAVRGLSIWLRLWKVMRAEGTVPDGVSPLGESNHMIKVLAALMNETPGISAHGGGQDGSPS
jgi:aminoglycoside phosphotransferase (APT) family kinase protein